MNEAVSAFVYVSVAVAAKGLCQDLWPGGQQLGGIDFYTA
jgi:hypothetical protein